MGPADVDVAQIYDAFTPLILLSLEGYGFCGRGEAGDFVLEGNLRWGSGSLPTNTSGGGLSEAYVHGFNLITEGVRQMRGHLDQPGGRRPDLPGHIGRGRADQCASCCGQPE